MATATAALAGVKAVAPPPITVDIDEPSKPTGPGIDGVGPAKVLADTVWIADWSFDSGGCNSTGWVKYDNRIQNDGSNYWVVDNRFDTVGGVVGKAAVLFKHDLCWERDGYGNDWDYSVILKYRGTGATLSCSFLSDTQPGADFVLIEADSAGASESRVNYAINPKAVQESFRVLLFITDGPNLSGSIASLGLPDFGVPSTTHEVYLRFHSDDEASDEDGYYVSSHQAGLVVDNLVVTGNLAYSENFSGALNPNVSLVNTGPTAPAGEWARLFSHITDNDKCTENTTCAWLLSDPTRIALFPDMAFGPGSAIVRNWLDDVFVSPWVSLASTPTATGTALQYRMFDGQKFSRGKIVQQWRVRSRLRIDNTDTSAPGDSIDCYTPWSGKIFSQLDGFQWEVRLFDLTTDIDPLARDVQVSFRTTDWQLVTGDAPPVTLNTGPGPFIDRVRIGRRVASGPAVSEGIDARSQAQDCFPTVQNAISPGEHFSPDGSNRFGTCAFSRGADLGVNSPGSPNLITGDSITLLAIDGRGAGGITSVNWYGAITAGPHAGKAPAPYTIGGNGFFQVAADSARAASGVAVRGGWFIDLDDTYFRGGDRLEYFWAVTDAGGGFASVPSGLTALPASVNAARAATNGLREVNALPAINWAPAYLARIAADAHGDLAPTGAELAASSQRNCILYVNAFDAGRRSGNTHRTSFMYTLDNLGYSGYYDVYDQLAFGNANCQVGGRANVGQVAGYSLIIQDTGQQRSNTLTNAASFDFKVDQSSWYRSYLAQGVSGLAGTATLWILGNNVAEEFPADPLLATDMGLTGVTGNQGLSANPDVKGVASFTFHTGCVANFTTDAFSLLGGCPGGADFDGLGATGTAVITHRYFSGATSGAGAVVMNKNSILKWNSVFMAFNWYDIRDASGSTPGTGENTLMSRILNCALPLACQHSEPTGVLDPVVEAVPAVTALHACVPNPFNPTTAIAFDLARPGAVRLEIFDAAGRLVRTLVAAELPAGRHRVVWNGLDGKGRRSASGVYFDRLTVDGWRDTRKMLLLQ
jgi:hypothetical protein